MGHSRIVLAERPAQRMMAEKPHALRLFFAFELTDDVRAFAAEARAKLMERIDPRDMRWTAPADMHVTALFIGEYPHDRLPYLTSAGEATAKEAAPFHLTVGGLGRFPERGVPRVVWMGAHEPGHKPASAIVRRLRSHLSETKLDRKPFKPHVTLGYVRPSAHGPAVDAALDELNSSMECGFTAARLVLMQTISEAERRKSGMARYNIVHVFSFMDLPP